MIILRKQYSATDESDVAKKEETDKKKTKLAKAAGISLMGMGGTTAGLATMIGGAKKKYGKMTVEEIKKLHPKLSDKAIKKYLERLPTDKQVGSAKKTGSLAAVAGALTLGAALYNQKKSEKDDSTKN